MEVKSEKRDNKYRLVESETGKIAKDEDGIAVDRGGKKSGISIRFLAVAVNTANSKPRDMNNASR